MAIHKQSGDRRILFDRQHRRGSLVSSLASWLIQIEAAATKSPRAHCYSILIHTYGVFRHQTTPVIWHLHHLHNRLIVALYFGHFLPAPFNMVIIFIISFLMCSYFQPVSCGSQHERLPPPCQARSFPPAFRLSLLHLKITADFIYLPSLFHPRTHAATCFTPRPSTCPKQRGR